MGIQDTQSYSVTTTYSPPKQSTASCLDAFGEIWIRPLRFKGAVDRMYLTDRRQGFKVYSNSAHRRLSIQTDTNGEAISSIEVSAGTGVRFLQPRILVLQPSLPAKNTLQL